MKNVIQNSRFRTGTISILRSGFRVIFIFLCTFLILISEASAEVTHLQVLNADGERLKPLRLFERQSVKYVLETEMAERFSGTRMYEPLVKRVTITMMGKRIVFTLGRRQLKLNDEKYVLANPPVSISSKMAIPVEFLADILPRVIGKHVILDRENWVLRISREPFINNGEMEPDTHIPVESTAEFRVIIDPGHGGRDVGARTKFGRQEKDQTLKIAQQVANLLAAEKGIAVNLTRSGDKYMTTAERVNNANKLRGHVYLGIHFNWSPSQRSKGFRIYVNSNQMQLGTGFHLGTDVFSEGKSDASEPPETKSFLLHSKLLAKEVAKQLRNMGLTGEQDNQVFLANVDDLSMPCILVEVLYFSNSQDLKILSRPDFIASVSRAFCDSILAFRDALRDENAL